MTSLLVHYWRITSTTTTYLACYGIKASRILSVTRVFGVAVANSFAIEKELKPTVSSNAMDEDSSQKDAALLHSDGGPLKRVRDQGGLESEGLTLRSGSVLRGRSPHMSQISDSQALIESSAVTAQGQTVLSQSESESAITHPVSTAAADLSTVTATLPGQLTHQSSNSLSIFHPPLWSWLKLSQVYYCFNSRIKLLTCTTQIIR